VASAFTAIPSAEQLGRPSGYTAQVAPAELRPEARNNLKPVLNPVGPTETVASIEHARDLRPPLPILLYNVAQVELPVLFEAETVATHIFAQAGIGAIWTITVLNFPLSAPRSCEISAFTAGSASSHCAQKPASSLRSQQ
jgi:hypothetical protein